MSKIFERAIAASAAPSRGERISGHVSHAALSRVLLRSFFIQAAWNPRGMQNLGFAHAIAPALAELYPDPQARARATLRHLEFFNCHPYLAAAILGASIRLEEQAARGETSPEAVSALKRALAPPFAALGDGFFWLALRPAAALVAAFTVPTLGLGSVLVFLGLYNAAHLSARVWLFAQGYRRGEGIVEVVARVQVPAGTGLIKIASAVIAGALAARALLLALVPHALDVHSRFWHAGLLFATAVAMTALLPRLRFGTALYLTLALGFAAGSGFF